MKIRSFVIFLLAAVAAVSLVAMPTEQELKRVEGLVQELMRPEMEALKAGKKNRADVAKAATGLAGQAESEAAKLLLLKGAFIFYVADGAFDEAVETLKTVRATIPGIPPQNLANMIESALRGTPKSSGGRLYRILAGMKSHMRHQDELKAYRAKLSKDRKNASLHVKIAEKHAYFGDWAGALEEFAMGDNPKAAEVARAERGDDDKLSKKAIADFWWEYPAGGVEEVQRAFRRHAAALYAKAISTGAISGLVQIQAQRRIDEAKGYEEDVFAETAAADVPAAPAGVAPRAAGVSPAPVGGAPAASASAVAPSEHGRVRLWEDGPYWAETNVGAEKPWEAGYYFWWGDVVGYRRENDAWAASDGSRSGFSFAPENVPTYGKDIDTLRSEEWITADGTLAPKHDAAHVQWGGGWRMPTKQELRDLNSKCDWTWTTTNGVCGYVVRGRDGYAKNSIFLPVGGVGFNKRLDGAGQDGYYWSSAPNSGNTANGVKFSLNKHYQDGGRRRERGQLVRAVAKER